MQSVDSRMSPSAAKHAVTHARTQPVVPESSLPQFALHAAERQRFLSSPKQTALYIAASASLR